jgi:hypothetical protein
LTVFCYFPYAGTSPYIDPTTPNLVDRPFKALKLSISVQHTKKFVLKSKSRKAHQDPWALSSQNGKAVKSTFKLLWMQADMSIFPLSGMAQQRAGIHKLQTTSIKRSQIQATQISRTQVHIPGWQRICNGPVDPTIFQTRRKAVQMTATSEVKIPKVTTTNTRAAQHRSITFSSSTASPPLSHMATSESKKKRIFGIVPESPPQNTLTTMYTKRTMSIDQQSTVAIAPNVATAVPHSFITQDKLPDPPEISGSIFWALLALLCLGLLFTVRLYFIVFPVNCDRVRNWFHWDIFRGKSPAVGFTAKKDDGVVEYGNEDGQGKSTRIPSISEEDEQLCHRTVYSKVLGD